MMQISQQDQDRRSNIAALYQEINRGLADLTPDDNFGREHGSSSSSSSSSSRLGASYSERRNRRSSRKDKNTRTIWRDATTHWVVPTYSAVLQCVRGGTAIFSLVHGNSPKNPVVVAAASSSRRRTRSASSFSSIRNGRADSLPAEKKKKEKEKKKKKQSSHVMLNIDSNRNQKEKAASTKKRQQLSRSRRPPTELEPHEKYHEREKLLSTFVQNSGLRMKGILMLYRTFLSSMLPSTSNNRNAGSASGDGEVLVLAHVFLREIAKLLPAKDLHNGLDELLFINFDVDYVGTMDVREFILELASCGAMRLANHQMVRVLYTLYGTVPIDAENVAAAAGGGGGGGEISAGKQSETSNQRRKESISAILLPTQQHHNRYMKNKDARERTRTSRIPAVVLAGMMHRGMSDTKALVHSVEMFLSALDEDGDGVITWTEFLSSVLNDHNVLDNFRKAYSSPRSSRMMGVMMFSPLNRFMRRVQLDWRMLTKLWNEMNTAGIQYRVVSEGSEGSGGIDSRGGGSVVVGEKGGGIVVSSSSGSGADGGSTNIGGVDGGGGGGGGADGVPNNDTSDREPEPDPNPGPGPGPGDSGGGDNDNDNDGVSIGVGLSSRVLLNYSQFRDIVKPFFGKAKPGDAPLMSDLFEAAVASNTSYVDQQGVNITVADCHRFAIDLSSALEDASPAMGSNTIQRARFYFMMLDLDRNGTIDYDEVYEVVSRGQTAGLAQHVLQGRQLMRSLERDEDGAVEEEHFVDVTMDHPDLLWRVVHRYPSQ